MLTTLDYTNMDFSSDDRRDSDDSDRGSNRSNIMRVSNRPLSSRRLPLSPEEQERRWLMADDVILALLPGSRGYTGNAEKLTTCRDHQCGRQGTKQTYGYCNVHFCQEYREGNVDIPESVPATLDKVSSKLHGESSADEKVAGLSIQRTRTSDSGSPDTSPPQARRLTSEERRRSHTIRSPSAGKHGRNAHGTSTVPKPGNSSSSSDENSKKPKPCVSPMCTRNAEMGDLCGRCYTKLAEAQQRQKVTEKTVHPCAFKKCKRRTDVKGTLCKKCNDILQRKNADRVEMPIAVQSQSNTNPSDRLRYQQQGARPRTGEPREGQSRRGAGPGPRHDRDGTGQRTYNEASRHHDSQHQRENRQQIDRVYGSKNHQRAQQGRVDVQHLVEEPRRAMNRNRNRTYNPSEAGVVVREPPLNDPDSPPCSFLSDTSSEQRNYGDRNSPPLHAPWDREHRFDRPVRPDPERQRGRAHPALPTRNPHRGYSPTREANIPYNHLAPDVNESGPTSMIFSFGLDDEGVDNGYFPPRRLCKKQGCKFYGDRRFQGFCSVCYHTYGP